MIELNSLVIIKKDEPKPVFVQVRIGRQNKRRFGAPKITNKEVKNMKLFDFYAESKRLNEEFEEWFKKEFENLSEAQKQTHIKLLEQGILNDPFELANYRLEH